MICEFAAVNNLGGTGLSGIADNAVGTRFGILCGLNKRRILRYLIRWPVRERLRNRFAGIPWLNSRAESLFRELSPLAVTPP